MKRGGYMQFIDKAKIRVEAGKGGDGTVALDVRPMYQKVVQLEVMAVVVEV